MAKVLAQAGVSLADVYEVEGSIAGVDQLNTDEVHLSHEMGATIFSERLIGNLERLTTGALLQNISWDLTVVLEIGLYRVLGAVVLSDSGGRVDRAQVSLRSVVSGREIPIFVWDTAVDNRKNIRIVEEGAAVNLEYMNVITPQVMPTLGIPPPQQPGNNVGGEIVFRGLTTGFGAGDVTVTALIYVAFNAQTSISSRGLPIPGW